jgi:hypothetical protein
VHRARPNSWEICNTQLILDKLWPMVLVGHLLKNASKLARLIKSMVSASFNTPVPFIGDRPCIFLKWHSSHWKGHHLQLLLSKTGFIFLINKHVSILVLRKSYREPAPLRDLVTTCAPRILAWHPIFAFAPKICTKDCLSVGDHHMANYARRFPTPPLLRYTAYAKVHAWEKFQTYE